MKTFDKERIQILTNSLLDTLGEGSREGLKDTPRRVADFWEEFLNPPEVDFTTFDTDGADEMVVQKGVTFFSLCEHHLLPFFGTAAVAYVPGKRIVGISKLARCVEFYAHRLQNQERLTKQIAERIQKEIEPLGVGVVLRARHLCCEMRGARTHNAETVTSFLIGTFKEEGSCRSEFLSLTKERSR